MDITKMYLTKYALALAFWTDELVTITDDTPLELRHYNNLVVHMIYDIRKNIKENLNEKDQYRIMNIVEEINYTINKTDE